MSVLPSYPTLRLYMNILNVVRLMHIVQCSLFLYLFFLLFAFCTLLRIKMLFILLLSRTWSSHWHLIFNFFVITRWPRQENSWSQERGWTSTWQENRNCECLFIRYYKWFTFLELFLLYTKVRILINTELNIFKLIFLSVIKISFGVIILTVHR